MAINFGNVNISLQQFQEISSGKYNAGEVKLTSETQIDKVNDHVTLKFLNDVKISQVEVLAIKNAFIEALRGGGVTGDALVKIREELGLSPMKSVDKSLHERSIKPLSRQQIREILDRHAEDINRHEGAGTILASKDLYAGVSEKTLASRAADREAANAELSTRRSIVESREINNLQAVLAGDVDFVPLKERNELLKMARQCLNAILSRSRGNLSDTEKASFQWKSTGGSTVELSSGLSEKALARKLEEMIVRLEMDKVPSQEQFAIRNEFKALAPEECAGWVANLANDPNGAFKARVVAVMIMHDRGVDDAATLSVVNQLGKDDAIALVTNLVSNGMNLEGDALRQSVPVQNALDCKDPNANIPDRELAYIPALTDAQFNEQIDFYMSGRGVNKLPATFHKILMDTINVVRDRYGAVGFPNKTNVSDITYGNELAEMIGTTNPDASRITPETLRDSYVNSALKAAAMRIFEAGVDARLKAAGLTGYSSIVVTNGVRARNGDILKRILEAPSQKAADAVLDDYKDTIVSYGKMTIACERCYKSLAGWAREAMAKKLGVPAASLQGGAFSTENLVNKGSDLRNAIIDGSNKANFEEEVEAEFKKFVDKFVDERVKVLDKVDKADISDEAKAAVKADLLSKNKFNYLDIDAMVAAAKGISTANLAKLLANKAPKQEVFTAMRAITAEINAAMRKMFEPAIKAGKEIGTEEFSNYITPMVSMVVHSTPVLAENLALFYASPEMAEENLFDVDENNEGHPAANFMAFAQEPGENAALASKLGTENLPVFYTQALMQAVRNEGLGNLTAAETHALFAPGQPAGDQMRAVLSSAEGTVRPAAFGVLARSVLRKCRNDNQIKLQNPQKVENFAKDFMSGNCAKSARAAGYHASELPRLARAFALYKVAMGVSDAAALSAVLDPTSKVSRLMSYGGRFMESAEDFRAGLILMDRFAEWYANLAAGARSEHPDTLSKVNASAGSTRPDAVKAYELFVFQDLAIRPDVNLNADPETLFGIEHNDVVNFFSRANGVSYIATFVKLPPAKRQVLFAAFKAIEPPRPENPDHSLTDVSDHAGYIARILRHYDEVAELMAAGNLDRTHLNQILTPDLDLPPDATSKQVREAIQARVYAKYANSFEKIMKVSTLMGYTGCTVTEALEAVETGKKPANLPDIASTTMRIENIDGTTNAGREMMLGDLCRPSNPSYVGGRQTILSDDENHFVVKIGGETIKCIRSGNPDVNAPIADKIENLCGKVHVEQANTVMRGLAQGAHLTLTPNLSQFGIAGSEHMPLTYTITKEDETGDVTITYSEPEGLKDKDGRSVSFFWTTTIALDGTSTTTPLMIASPVQPANGEKPGVVNINEV